MEQHPPAPKPAVITPLLERTSSAMALSLVAGLLNAWTFGAVQSFATVQSGNIVTLGYELLAGNLPRVASVGISILSFAAGSFVSMIAILLLAKKRRNYSAPILEFEAAAVLLLGVLAATGVLQPLVVAWAISFVAGVQGNSFHRETGMLYGNVAVTFVLQSVGSLLARAAGRKILTDNAPHMRPAGAYAAVLLAFAVGGAVGFAIDQAVGEAAFYLAAVILIGLAFAASVYRGPVDPSGTAPTP